MKVCIPFKEKFKQPLLDGTKKWTTRSHAYGKIGDVFDAFGATFVLDNVEWMRLGDVGAHWRDEGCTSLEDFIATWCKIHPGKGYNPESVYCVHIFHKETSQT